ncbi:unnamed protein product, partial [Adineta ricciae]
TGDETWIYHRKIKAKEQCKVWVRKDESPATEVRRQQYEKKTMFIISFMSTGPLVVNELPSGMSIDAVYYRDECLKKLISKLRKKRPLSLTKGIKLHHDNARPHMNNIIFDHVQQHKMQIMVHPPYSPDLALCDFWLFGYLKRNLDTYPDSTSLATALTKELNSIPVYEYQKTFQKWIQRMKLCIEHRGDYFEHLM